MAEPVFVYDDMYYYNIDTNTIHGKERNSQKYWHEYSHYRDYSNKLYKSIGLGIALLNEYIAISFPFCFILCLITGEWFNLFSVLGYVFVPFCLWSFQEEVRAEIYGMIKSRQKR